MTAEGAQWLVVPAAFTVPTGRAHWELLLRARAVENLAFVVAPGQSGVHASGRETYGDSMIVDHWGEVLGRLPEGEGIVTARFDLDAQRQVRESFPALAHRRL
jgi:nitrilase